MGSCAKEKRREGNERRGGGEGGAGQGGGGAEQSTQREDAPASQPLPRAAVSHEEEWRGWRKPPEQFAFGALGRVPGAPPGSSMSEVKAPRGFQQVGLLGVREAPAVSPPAL